jgi:hypothetical protein
MMMILLLLVKHPLRRCVRGVAFIRNRGGFVIGATRMQLTVSALLCSCSDC